MAKWTDEQLALLGELTDREVAERTGRGVSAVTARRRDLGIAASQPRAYEWSAAEDALLGTVTDQEAADRLGVSRKCVHARRDAQLGPPVRRGVTG